MELPEKIEEMLVAWLETRPNGTFPATFPITSISAGETDETLDSTSIVCIAGDAEEEVPPNTGNKWFTARIEIRTPPTSPESDNQADPLALHKELAHAIETLLQVDNLISQFEAAAAAKALADADFADLANFQVFGLIDRHQLRAETENMWMSGMSFRIYCCGIAP